MTGFGIACAAFCACPLKFRQRPGTSPRCRWFWAVWDCAVLCAPGGCVLCQLGRLYFIQRRRNAVVTSTLNSTSGLRASDFAVSGVSNFQAGAIWLAATVLRLATEDDELGGRQAGWQHEVSSGVEQSFNEDNCAPQLAEHERALLWPQSRPHRGHVSAVPSNFLTRIDAHLSRVVLLRRLLSHLSLWSSARLIWPSQGSVRWCRIAWSPAVTLESAGARVRREAGGETRIDQHHGARLGFGGMCWMVEDWTFSRKGSICPEECSNGSARLQAADIDGVALAAARRRKELTELVGPHSRAKMVVLALEVAGGWSAEAATFIEIFC